MATTTITVNVAESQNYLATSRTISVESATKEAGYITLSANSVTITGVSGTTQTVTITSNSGGTLSVSSSDTSKVTASLSGTTITLTSVADGNATITVTVGATSTHTSATATISVLCEISTPLPLPYSGKHIGYIVYNNRIYMIGGKDSNGDNIQPATIRYLRDDVTPKFWSRLTTGPSEGCAPSHNMAEYYDITDTYSSIYFKGEKDGEAYYKVNNIEMRCTQLTSNYPGLVNYGQYVARIGTNLYVVGKDDKYSRAYLYRFYYNNWVKLFKISSVMDFMANKFVLLAYNNLLYFINAQGNSGASTKYYYTYDGTNVSNKIYLSDPNNVWSVNNEYDGMVTIHNNRVLGVDRAWRICEVDFTNNTITKLWDLNFVSGETSDAHYAESTLLSFKNQLHLFTDEYRNIPSKHYIVNEDNGNLIPYS